MLEVVLAGALGVAVVLLLLAPLLTGARREPELLEPLPVEETRRGQALLALKDLEFDHATGKISDEDYGDLRSRFTGDALSVLRREAVDPAAALVAERRAVLEGRAAPRGACPSCGPRPEPDARYCSDCGAALAPPPA